MADLLNLQQLRCKTCGEPLDLSKAQCGVIKCAVCDSCFTLPKTDASQKVLDYLFQAEGDLDTGRFEDAHVKYSKAAELDKTEPEAYWGMALAEFKIQYLKDEVNNRLQPICHEINDKDFADSPYFLKALRYATEAQRAEYERKAEEINYIKNEFYKIAKTGVKYDCFICVKVSAEDGGRTQDYKIADDIYFELKGKGYRPFFSERELVGVTGADYEARILYALKSSECMLVVCFDEAYLRTKWVKNEYLRFLKLVNDEEKESDSIALVFGDRPVEKLPGKKGKIQGIALNSLTAMERIVSFVDAHTPEARKRREEQARRKDRENEDLRNELAELKKMLLGQQQQSKQYMKEHEDKEWLKAEKKERKTELKEAKKESKQAEEEKERQEKERAEAERAERERKEAEARARQERETKKVEEMLRQKDAQNKQLKKDAEERARIQAEIEKQEKERISRDFEIENGVLRKYKGNDTDVIIPDSVTKIGAHSFDRCSRIERITIPNSVTDIGEYAFSDCIGLISIDIPNSIISIGNSAFWSCKKLKNIVIPSSVKKIGRWLFRHCIDIESIKVDVNNSNYRGANNCILSKDGATLIFGCKNSIIPEGVTSIGECAFGACRNLKSITIPSSVTCIGDDAFSECSGLTSIEIPNSVTSIGNTAFRECENLRNVKFPDSVKSIGFMAFNGCGKFADIIIPNSVTSIGSYAFKSCSKLEKVIIPESVTEMGEEVFCKWYSKFDNNADLTIYCRAKKQPKGWNYNWNKKATNKLISGKHKVVWGYKGN